MAKLKQNKLLESFRRAATVNSGTVHIIESLDGWSVKKEGSKKALVIKPSEFYALKVAANIKSASSIVVHKSDGAFTNNKRVRILNKKDSWIVQPVGLKKVTSTFSTIDSALNEAISMSASEIILNNSTVKKK